MELQKLLQVFKKRMLFILVITFATVSTSAVVSYFIIAPVYKSDISVIIGKVGTSTDAGSQPTSYDDVVMYQMLVKTYIELVKSRTVAEDVIQSLALSIKPEALQKMISITPKGDTEFLTIAVRSNNAEQVMRIANQLAKSLKEVSFKVKKVDNVQVLDTAEFPMAPDSPRPPFNIAIAFFLGLTVSLSLAFLLEQLDNTIKTEEDIEKLIGIPVIGIIPYEEEIK